MVLSCKTVKIVVRVIGIEKLVQKPFHPAFTAVRQFHGVLAGLLSLANIQAFQPLLHNTKRYGMQTLVP